MLFDLTNFYFEGRKAQSRKGMLRRIGYDYLCVTRNKIKDYTISPDHTTVEVTDSRGKRITLRQVKPTVDGDTYFEVVSPSKALTEASMNRMWKERFEEELNPKMSLGPHTAI